MSDTLMTKEQLLARARMSEQRERQLIATGEKDADEIERLEAERDDLRRLARWLWEWMDASIRPTFGALLFNCPQPEAHAAALLLRIGGWRP